MKQTNRTIKRTKKKKVEVEIGGCSHKPRIADSCEKVEEVSSLET
jgi:hypothetical protein